MPARPTPSEITEAIEAAWSRHRAVRRLGRTIAAGLPGAGVAALTLTPLVEGLLWAFVALLLVLADDPVRRARRKTLLAAAIEVIRRCASDGAAHL